MRRVAQALGLFVLWSVPGLLSTSATLLLFPNSPAIGGNVRRYLILSLAPWWTWVLLTPAVILLARRFPIDDRSWRRIAIHLSAAVAAGLIYVFGAAVTSWGAIRLSPFVMT